MKIIEYKSCDKGKGEWDFSKIVLGKVNLLVGNSGTGKTRFLNTLFNLGYSAVNNQIKKRGFWEITFTINNKNYEWVFETEKLDDEKLVVAIDSLKEVLKNGEDRVIVERNRDTFKFFEEDLPKLSKNVSSICLLKEEEEIAPIHKGFSSILRRNFWDAELQKNFAISSFPQKIFDNIIKKRDIEAIFTNDLPVNYKLLFLSKTNRNKYNKVIEMYREIFPSIKSFEIKHTFMFMGNPAPVTYVKEKNVRKEIPIHQLSSGMQKVLLLLVDMIILPNGGIFLIDEYENSLGINSINFLPTMLSTFDNDNQFIITSHHPYLINNIPVKDWQIFHRKGSKVTIKPGKDYEEKFGKSKQQHFLQLLNDPFYNEGIE